jgi:hypothetical protein
MGQEGIELALRRQRMASPAFCIMIQKMQQFGNSSTIAGVSLWRCLDELRRRNVGLRYSAADAEAEIKGAMALKRGKPTCFSRGWLTACNFLNEW